MEPPFTVNDVVVCVDNHLAPFIKVGLKYEIVSTYYSILSHSHLVYIKPPMQYLSNWKIGIGPYSTDRFQSVMLKIKDYDPTQQGDTEEDI